MSKIISPIPITITLEFNEMNGACRYTLSRHIDFAQFAVILAQMTIQYAKDCEQMMRQAWNDPEVRARLQAAGIQFNPPKEGGPGNGGTSGS